jgi:membrane fusion protein (multidrug efflux system)
MSKFFKKVWQYKFAVMMAVIGLGLAMAWLTLGQRGTRKGNSLKDMGPVEEKAVIRIFQVRKTGFSDYLEAMGTIKGNNEIELKFPVSGYLTRINFKEGDWIEKGQVIAELDSNEAELRLGKARIEFENTEKLYKLGAVAKEKYEEARLNLGLAEEEKKRHLISSPWRGVLGEIEKETGAFVTPQDKLASFIEASSVYVEIGVIEKEIRKISQGQLAEVRVDTYPEKVFEGKVTTIIPFVSGSNRTMRVRIKTGNPRGELLPGMFARARVLIYEEVSALVVPVSSIFQEGDKFLVFKVAGDRLVECPVNIRYLKEDYAEVKDGVSEGDEVALKVMGELVDGKRIEIISEDKAR